MILSEFLYGLGVCLLPFIIFIGFSTNPSKGFYYLSFFISAALIIPSLISNGSSPNLSAGHYLLISINSSILSIMLIGHWFLVDPTIDRKGMKQVAAYGIGTSFVATIQQLVNLYIETSQSLYPMNLINYVVMGLFFSTCILTIGANSSLNEKGYSGVMAATGLSYLSFLTSIGAVGTLLLVS